MQARDIMTKDPITAKPGATIREVAEILVENKISGLPVVDENGVMLGIVSEGDLMRKKIAPKAPEILSVLGAIIYYDGLKEYREAFRKLSAVTAQEIMTKDVISVQPEEDVSKVGQLMLDHHVKRVPVLNGRRLVGIISRSDMVKMLL
ncbi:CBS domain-containing protein [Selenomonas sputigena]|uniref:CBS domain-containing protein n=1 Tax=Selenomonas sputigena TaxID=69823 RepID=A0ABV3X2V4_9FIRM